MSKYKKGKIVIGTVTCIENYGAFMSFDEYYTGLIHISEISKGYIRDINEYLNVGDTIYVKILDVDEEEAHLKLSIKNINYKYNEKYKKSRIIETKSGFKTLEKKLPIWIDNELKKIKNTPNYVDKQIDRWYINMCLKEFFGRLAQLVRAPALQAGGHRFESYSAHHFLPE